MAAGIQVKGDHGVIQIDADYRNLVFISKHTFTTTTGGLIADSSYGSISFTGRTTPVIAIRSTMATTVMAATIGSTSTFYIIAKGPVGQTFTVYLYDVPPPPSAHGVGLQVFDASGNIAFDSNWKPMVVSDAFSVPSSFLTANGSSSWRTIPTGRQWAIVHSANTIRGRAAAPGGMGSVTVIVRGVGFTYSGQTLSMEIYSLFQYSGAPDTDTLGIPGQYLAIDVTNL